MALDQFISYSESAKCLPRDPFGMNLGFNFYDLLERLPRDPFEMDIPTSNDAINSGQVFPSPDLAYTMPSPMIFDESITSNASSEMDVQNPSAPFSTTGEVPEGFVYALHYLGVKDLLSVEQVCKSLNEAVRSESLLWMSIQFDSAWRDILNDETLLKVTRKSKGNLKTLAMVSCGNVSNEGLRCVLEENPLLNKLYVPDCVNLSLDSLITNLKSFNSRNYPGIQHLKLGRLFQISESQYNELIAVLQTNSYRPTAQPKPHLYHIARFSIMCNEDRALDIERCPRCQGLKLVYDCPLDGCKGDNGTCRGCEACIRRCLLCGNCIPDDSTYDETFNYDHICGICISNQVLLSLL